MKRRNFLRTLATGLVGAIGLFLTGRTVKAVGFLKHEVSGLEVDGIGDGTILVGTGAGKLEPALGPKLVYHEAVVALKELAFLFYESEESQARITKLLINDCCRFDIEVDKATTGERILVYKPSAEMRHIIAICEEKRRPRI